MRLEEPPERMATVIAGVERFADFLGGIDGGPGHGAGGAGQGQRVDKEIIGDELGPVSHPRHWALDPGLSP